MALLPKRKLFLTKICLLVAILCVPSFVNLLVLLPRKRAFNVVRNGVTKISSFSNYSEKENRLRMHVDISNGNLTNFQPITRTSSNNLRLPRQAHQEVGAGNQRTKLLKHNHPSNSRKRVGIDKFTIEPVNLNPKNVAGMNQETMKIQLRQETETSVHRFNVSEMMNVKTIRKPTEVKISSASAKLTLSSSNQISSKEGHTKNKTVSFSRQTEPSQEVPCVTIGVYCSIKKGRWHGYHFCPGTNCPVKVVQSENYTKLRDADALYIPQNSLSSVNLHKLNTLRRREQVWIFNAFESPVHTFTNGGRWTNLGFNWTLTYRTDSTFPSPYGRYNPGYPIVPANDTTNWAANKTKFAAWIGSNCGNTQWPRLTYVKKLQNFIPLDTFGSCGTKTCPKNLSCGKILRQYKFFFALENSACKDYITEKFWAAPFRNNMIPVVYGPSREDYEKVAPPKSFIHVQDFKTMEELSRYLKAIDENDSLFNEYFEWKKQGSVDMDLIGNYYISKKIMCPIGAKILSTRREGNLEKSTVDMTTWWINSCRRGLTP